MTAPSPRETWAIANGIPRQVFGTLLLNVHARADCQMGCPLHGPSMHRMRAWPLSYRSDRRIFERLCVDGVGHPDPDSVIFHAYALKDPSQHRHGCDGCCIGFTSVEV